MSARNEPGLFQALRLLYGRLSPERRRAVFPLAGLMLLGALAELATIGALVPLLSLMADPNGPRISFLAPLLNLVGGVQSPNAVLVLIGLFAAAAIASAAVRLLLLWSANTFVGGVAHELSTRSYSDTLHERYQYHTSRNSSEIIAIVNKTQLLSSQVLSPLMNGAVALVVACFIIAGLLLVDPIVALLAGASFVAIYLTVSVLIRRRLRSNSVVISRTQSERIKAMQDGLGGIRDVTLDQSQSVFVDVFDRAEARFRAASVRNSFLSGAPRLLVEAVGMIMIALVAALMSGRPGGLAAAVPVVGALALGAQRLLPLIQQIYAAWASSVGNKQIVLDVYDLLSHPPARQLAERALPFSNAIELRDVSFAYHLDHPAVIRNVDLVIRKGSRVGLAGKTGSGKSTLADIVLGLLEPGSGVISVDGVPLGDDNRFAWQRNVAHVPQAIYLADATIAENIAFGVPSARIDHARIRRAAEQAELGDVVAALPHGYDTRVGERGIQLSGGQRQRIGIARALYKDAQVLVFDEATSALDTTTEAAVMAAIDRLDSGLTIVIIAHRLSTLDACDTVVWLEAGRVREIEDRTLATPAALEGR